MKCPVCKTEINVLSADKNHLLSQPYKLVLDVQGECLGCCERYEWFIEAKKFSVREFGLVQKAKN